MAIFFGPLWHGLSYTCAACQRRRSDVRTRLPRWSALQMDRSFSVRDGSGRYVATAQTLAGAAELVSNSEDLSLRIDHLDRCVFGPDDDECEVADIVRLITKRVNIQ